MKNDRKSVMKAVKRDDRVSVNVPADLHKIEILLRKQKQKSINSESAFENLRNDTQIATDAVIRNGHA